MYKENRLSHNWSIHRAFNRVTREHLRCLSGVVYDLGCGNKPYSEEISAVARDYICVDWANSLHGSHADIVANLNCELPIKSQSADAVVSFQVLEHLCEPQLMLKEAHRALKQGGTIIVTVPFQWHVHEQPHDYFRYTRFGIEYIFRQAEFASISIKEVTGFWVMWFLKLNYQTKRLVRGPSILRAVILFLLVPFWFVNQYLAIFLDSWWPAAAETAGYFVKATKP